MKSPTKKGQAFTLIEVMTVVCVLSFFILIMAQLTDSTLSINRRANKHVDADSEARLVFERMNRDFSGIVNRTDVDFIFQKNSGNDVLFFQSESAGYTSDINNPAAVGSVSLVGYRINNNPTFGNGPALERLGKALTWDGAASGSTAGGSLFLTYTSGNAAPDTTSTIAGHWTSTIGSAPFTSGTDNAYHILSPQVFRLEFCFLLRDGTYSTKPVVTGTVTSNLTASAPPTPNNDSVHGYSSGSRWYDTAGSRAYICQSANTGAAVWKPLGLSDVSSIVVAIAVLDETSRKPVADKTKMAGALPDVTTIASSDDLMATQWQQAIENASFASLSGLSREAASNVRIYQRTFHINPISKGNLIP